MIRNKGFTLVELLIVLTIAAIVAAIGVPTWLNFLQKLEVRSARDNAYQVLLNAKSEARATKMVREVCFKQNGDRILYSTHYRVPGSACRNAVWEELNGDRVFIDPNNTTFYHASWEDAYRVQFNHLGVSHGRLGRITFVDRNGKNRHCTFLSTLLGAQRKTDGERCVR